MKINLISFDREADGSRYNVWPVVWDTDKEPLSKSSASNYGGGYDFVGVEPPHGGLAVTVRFTDVERLTMFIKTAHELTIGNGMGAATDEQSDQWTAFLRLLVATAEAAPKGTVS